MPKMRPAACPYASCVPCLGLDVVDLDGVWHELTCSFCRAHRGIHTLYILYNHISYICVIYIYIHIEREIHT